MPAVSLTSGSAQQRPELIGPHGGRVHNPSGARPLHHISPTAALGVHLGMRGCEARNGGLSQDDRVELARLRKENAELRMRCDVLRRSMALWIQEAMGW
jgi:hypothetical protein